MNIDLKKKSIDTSKINIGTELECLILDKDTLQDIHPEKSQQIFTTLEQKHAWNLHKNKKETEIHAATKKLGNKTTTIKLDLSYAIFEITTVEPVESLEILEQIHSQSLSEFRSALKENKCIIWPFGVAPASTGLLKTQTSTKENIVDDEYYALINRLYRISQFCHITSHQVSVDTPLAQVVPMMNALYKNLGEIITTFANAAAFQDGKLYKEGRYYWWRDCYPDFKKHKYTCRAHQFPEKEFESFDDFYTRVFRGGVFVVRDGWTLTFKNLSMTVERFLKDRKGVAIDQNGNETEVVLQKEDIPIFLKAFWIDFKPHFDLDENFTLEDFLTYYESRDLDGFFKKYCAHSWIEVRPCAPHLEDNAMIIPRYFYNIFSHADEYIDHSKGISWKQAQISFDNAIVVHKL